MDKKDFGARLLALRKQKGVSQAEVAGYIGLTVAAYQNYENGRREAGYETISKLADFYHVSIDYLFGKDAIAEPNDPIKDMSDRLNLNPYERAIISAYLAMDSKSRKDLVKMISDVAESVKSGTEYEKKYTMHIDPKESRREQKQMVKQSTTTTYIKVAARGGEPPHTEEMTQAEQERIANLPRVPDDL